MRRQIRILKLSSKVFEGPKIVFERCKIDFEGPNIGFERPYNVLEAIHRH